MWHRGACQRQVGTRTAAHMTTILIYQRGVASVALRSLAIAAEVLIVRREQEEVFQIFDKIKKETGWRIGSIVDELKEKWGWGEDAAPNLHQQQYRPQQNMQDGGLPPPQQQQQPSLPSALMPQAAPLPPQQMQSYSQFQPSLQPLQPQQQNATALPPAPPPVNTAAAPVGIGNPARLRGSGIMNPLLATADFSMPQHPYQTHYVAPNQMPGQHGGHYAF